MSDHLFTFFVLTRPPPRPTLFPYTTLFRSLPIASECSGRQGSAACRMIRNSTARYRPCAIHAFTPCAYASRRDRKSTRLNSSHRTISYAVFCLKKKTSFFLFLIFDVLISPA